MQTGMTCTYLSLKGLHFIQLIRIGQFVMSVMLVFKYVWELTQGNSHKYLLYKVKDVKPLLFLNENQYIGGGYF